MVVVAEHGGHRDGDAGQRGDERLTFLEKAEVGEVAAEHEDIGRLLHALEDAAHLVAAVHAAVQVGERRDSHRGLPSRSSRGGLAPASR